MNNLAHETEAEDEEPDFKPLTAQEAQEWRRRNPPVSVWRIVAGQALVGMVVIPVLVVYIFLQSYIIKGMTAGAVKG